MWRQLVKTEILCITVYRVYFMMFVWWYCVQDIALGKTNITDWWCRITPCGGNCPSKPESAINIGLLSFLDIVQGREGENAKRSLREISNYARVTKACSSHHQIVSVLHQNECAVEMLKIFEGKVERCEGSLICSLASDNHCTASSQPSVMLPHVLQMINYTSSRCHLQLQIVQDNSELWRNHLPFYSLV